MPIFFSTEVFFSNNRILYASLYAMTLCYALLRTVLIDVFHSHCNRNRCLRSENLSTQIRTSNTQFKLTNNIIYIIATIYANTFRFCRILSWLDDIGVGCFCVDVRRRDFRCEFVNNMRNRYGLRQSIDTYSHTQEDVLQHDNNKSLSLFFFLLFFPLFIPDFPPKLRSYWFCEEERLHCIYYVCV